MRGNPGFDTRSALDTSWDSADSGGGVTYTLIKHNLTGSIFRCRIVLPTVLMGGSKI